VAGGSGSVKDDAAASGGEGAADVDVGLMGSPQTSQKSSVVES
jgi:hypothetical protein